MYALGPRTHVLGRFWSAKRGLDPQLLCEDGMRLVVSYGAR